MHNIYNGIVQCSDSLIFKYQVKTDLNNINDNLNTYFYKNKRTN